jgi:ribosomal protein S18 acetylase RimI-like enzyme
MNVRIRKMRVEDTAALAELWHEMVLFHAKGDPYWRVKRDCKGGYADHMRNTLGAPDKAVYVAYSDGDVIGFVLAQLDSRARVFVEKDHGLIVDLAVTAAHRRKGIGEKLVKKVWGWFGRKGVRTVEVRAAASNPVATAFWRKMGFEQYMAICKKKVQT